jgi:hypothetical protein
MRSHRFRKWLAAYLAVEVAIHDTLSLIAGVSALMAGAMFPGLLLIGWAASEILIKGVAAWVLAHDDAGAAEGGAE